VRLAVFLCLFFEITILKIDSKQTFLLLSLHIKVNIFFTSEAINKMTNKIKQFWIQEQKSLLFAFTYFIICFNSSAQTDPIYFDSNWKNCSKELAVYYRIQPKKVKTKEAIGYKINGIDSLYSIEDYYLKNNKLQFQGYSKDQQAQELVGNSKWFDENGILLNTQNHNYKNTSKLLDWQPIFYINYSITVKSQFTGGLEFCLDCEDRNKLFLGLGYGLSSYDNNYFGLPDVHLSYNTTNFGFIKIGGSNRNIYAIAGLTFLNLMDLGFGYSYPITNDKTPELKGFTFGLTFRITNNQKAYGKLKIGF
jgi:hypothetical protein